jgi:hypothetical protein
MKRILLYIVIVILVSGSKGRGNGAETNVAGATNCNAQLSIALENAGKGIKTNQPFNLVVQVKNLSTNETILFRDWTRLEADPDFWFEIVAPSGENISPRVNPFPHGSGTWRTMCYRLRRR